MDEQTTPNPDPVVTNSPATEPPQAEPVSAPETPQTTTSSEPIAETTTAQMAGNEPLPESQPASAPSAEAQVEAPQPETPTPTQGLTSQPEPTPPPVSPMPAQAQVTTSPRNMARIFLEKAKAVIQFRKQKKLAKIMTLFLKKKHITNDEVEKLLHVSDATATRYLSELEKQGKITQTGKTGHAVTYTKR